jgi:hypothetical protein
MKLFILSFLCVFFIGCASAHMEYGEQAKGWGIIVAKSQPEAAGQRHIVVIDSLEHIYVVDNEEIWKTFNIEEAGLLEYRRTYLVVNGEKYLYDYYLRKVGSVDLWPNSLVP